MAAFVMAFVPWVTFATWLVAIPAIVLSVIGMVKSSARAQPILGLVFAILGWGVSLFAIAITAAWLTPESDNDFSIGNNSSQVAEDNTVAEDQFGEETLGQQNARERAENYLESMAFSRSGLIDQLEFNGFTPEEAAYGVTQVGF